MNSPQRWDELAAAAARARLGWAQDAYRRFHAQLPAEIRASLPVSHTDINVMLYGPSQAGKTTLVLTLLGVRPDRFRPIRRMLRGGRPLGSSATSVATRYHAAAGDAWTWQVGDAQPRICAEDDVRSLLIDVRAKVEANEWDPAWIVEIGLPSAYLEETGPGMRVLDLPGVAARDPAERAHVERLVTDWTDVADVVLLVGPAHEERFLEPNAIEVLALRTWTLLPQRYRVVLTRAFLAETTQKWILAEGVPPLTIADVRDRLLGALASHQMPLPSAHHHPASWLYPLEIGDTWEVFLRRPYAETEPIRRLRDPALVQLQQDLIRASRPETRIRTAYGVGELARGFRQKREEELAAHVATVRRALRRAVLRRAARQRAATRHDAALQSSLELRQRLAMLAEKVTDIRINQIERSWMIDPEDLGGLGFLQLHLISEATHKWQLWSATLRYEFMRHGLREPIDTAATELAKSARACVAAEFDAIHFKRWLARKSTRYRDRISRKVREAHEIAVARVQAHIQARAKEVLGHYGQWVDKWIETAQARQQRLASRRAAAAELVRRAQSDLRAANGYRAAELARIGEGVRIAEQFPAVLEMAYRERYRELMAGVATAQGPVAKLAASVAVLACARTYDTIRTHPWATVAERPFVEVE